MSIALFDTHTHFDVPDFDSDLGAIGVCGQGSRRRTFGTDWLCTITFSRFNLYTTVFKPTWSMCHKVILHQACILFYIEQHQDRTFTRFRTVLQQQHCVAVGEIGLDTFLVEHKQPEAFQKQQDFFCRAIGNRTPSTKTCTATYS